jgi:hypothetical protein
VTRKKCNIKYICVTEAKIAFKKHHTLTLSDIIK